MTASRTVTLARVATTVGFDAPPGPAVVVPERLGPVKLIRQLGEGGMGVVWLGHDELLDRAVAVKFLLEIPGSPADPRFAAFIDGAKAASAIRHPGLNPVLHADVSPTGGVPYLVMELIDGPTAHALAQGRLKSVRPDEPLLPLECVRVLIITTARAVAALHAAEIVHRDIKPANIMLDDSGQVVVTDFGLACPRPAAAFGARAGEVAGTPLYMAPEMFDGAVSARSDVYAIGITCFELLTGLPPFIGAIDELRGLHTTAPLPTDKLRARGVPEPIIEAIERACNKSPLYRPKSAQQLADALEAAFDQARIKPATPARLQRISAGTPDAASEPTPGPAEVSYYDKLTNLASVKRKSEPPPPLVPRAPLPPTESAEAKTPATPWPGPSIPATVPKSKTPTIVQAQTISTGQTPPPPPRPISAQAIAAQKALRTRLMLCIGGMVLATAGALGAGVLIINVVMYFVHLATEALQLGTPTAQGHQYLAGTPIFTTSMPVAVELPVTLLLGFLFVCLPFVLACEAHRRLVLHVPTLDGLLRCGWCGGELAPGSRCLECGCPAGGAPVTDNAPAFGFVYRALATICSVLAMAIVLFGVLAVAGVFAAAMHSAPPLNRWAVLTLIALPASIAGLGCYHLMAASTARLTGRTRCGWCASTVSFKDGALTCSGCGAV